MLTPLILPCSLRSNNGINFYGPKVKTNTGARTFCTCGPTLRNSLLVFVRSFPSTEIFLRLLKTCTHLFNLAFPPEMPALCTPSVCLSVFLDQTLDIGSWTLICLVRPLAWPPPRILTQLKVQI